MVKAIMHGCNGKMGQMITKLAQETQTVEIVAGVDVTDGISNPYPVFGRLEDCTADADVVIDFASAKAADALLDYCADRKIPCVLCTTGLSEEQLAHVREASEQVAVLRSANMSMGINLLFKLLKEAAPVLADAGFDIEIVEKHHNLKKDAPSGTALMLAESANEAFAEAKRYVCGREGMVGARTKGEIGIHAVRGGNIVGEHEVMFAGEDEIVTLSHSARSKRVFAAGAVKAAKFMCGKPAGHYDMQDVLKG